MRKRNFSKIFYLLIMNYSLSSDKASSFTFSCMVYLSYFLRTCPLMKLKKLVESCLCLVLIVSMFILEVRILAFNE